MGFSNYFSKDILALSNKINSSSEREIKEILNRNVIGIYFDSQYLDSRECALCLELIIRLASRFYPKLKIHGLSSDLTVHSKKLTKLAKDINKKIELVNDEEPAIIINTTRSKINGKTVFNVSSDGWMSYFSKKIPKDFGFSCNPFGASMAACIAISNCFRKIFELEGKYIIDDNLEFCAFNIGEKDLGKPINENPVIGKIDIVGLGAIGNSVIWAFSKIPGLVGEVNLIDHELVELSNLQRYILLKEKDQKKRKVDLAKKYLQNGRLKINCYKETWQSYIHKIKGGRCESEKVLVCVDSKKDRILIQSSLPKAILNAFTDHSRFGITRHPNFINDVCLSCIYIPDSRAENTLDAMANSLNMEDKKNKDLLYEYLNLNKPIDIAFLNEFARKNKIETDKLEKYIGQPLSNFYTQMACGYELLKMSNSKNNGDEIDVPLAFQSCMAGISLAAETFINAMGFNRRNDSDASYWETLEPINDENPYNINHIKNVSKKCICGDEIYQLAYKEKWDI